MYSFLQNEDRQTSAELRAIDVPPKYEEPPSYREAINMSTEQNLEEAMVNPST